MTITVDDIVERLNTATTISVQALHHTDHPERLAEPAEVFLKDIGHVRTDGSRASLWDVRHRTYYGVKYGWFSAWRIRRAVRRWAHRNGVNLAGYAR